MTITYCLKKYYYLALAIKLALVIDVTSYEDSGCYQTLYSKIQSSLNCLTHNARIVVMVTSASTKQSTEHNTFRQSPIGFTKNLSKEVGRKGPTANVIVINKDDEEQAEYDGDALLSLLSFFLLTK